MPTVELCSPCGEVPWNIAVANRHARDDPHSKCVKCLGFLHARDAVYGVSKCKFCENLRLITSINPNMDAEDSGCRCFQAFSTPHLRYVFLCTTLCFLYRISFMNGSSTDSSKQRLQGFCSTTRAFLPPTERSDRGNTSVGHRTRVLQPLLPCSKEGRRPETHPGSAASEFFPLQREVQDADDENHHGSDSRRGLVCHYRPKGCVFPHPGRSSTQKVPSVCLRREGLPIQGPSLRPGLGAENIHEMHGCCTGPFEAPGHSFAELPGRLAHSGSLQGASESSQGYCSTPHPFSWPQDERQEECAPPISANPVSGGSFGFHSDAGPFGSCPDIQFYSMSGPLQARPSCLCRFMPQAARPHGSGLPCVAPRAASHEAVWWMKELRLHPTVPATRLIRVSHGCSRPLLQWRAPAFLQSGVRMGAIHRRHMITTDASMTGWGAVFEGRPASG